MLITTRAPLKSLTLSIENKIVEWAVQMSDGSQVQAANVLGVSTSSVCRKKRKEERKKKKLDQILVRFNTKYY